MTATILDGKALAATIKGKLAARVTALKANGSAPGLGTVLVGDDPGSISYVAGKHRDCQEVGINSIRVDLKADASQADVLAAIKDLNNAKECTGYIVQLPLPKGINTQVILESIDPAKDADGNPTVVRWSRKTKQQYVMSELDGKATGWSAWYENGKWVSAKA